VRNVFADTALAWTILEGMADTPMRLEMKKSHYRDTTATPAYMDFDDTRTMSAPMSCAKTIPDTPTPETHPFAQRSEREQHTHEAMNNLRVCRALDNVILDTTTEAQDTVKDTTKDVTLSPRTPPSKRSLEDTLAIAQKALTKANKLEADHDALRMAVFDMAHTVSAIKNRMIEQYTMYGQLSARVDKKDMQEYFAQKTEQKKTPQGKKTGPYHSPAAEPIQEEPDKEEQEDDQFKYLEEEDQDTAKEGDTMPSTAGTSSMPGPGLGQIAPGAYADEKETRRIAGMSSDTELTQMKRMSEAVDQHTAIKPE